MYAELKIRSELYIEQDRGHFCSTCPDFCEGNLSLKYLAFQSFEFERTR
jgi:hypothetical protein